MHVEHKLENFVGYPDQTKLWLFQCAIAFSAGMDYSHFAFNKLK